MADFNQAGQRPSASFSAVIIGAVIGLVINLAFILAGLAIGVAVFQVELGESLGTGALVGAGAVALVSTVVSYYIGGYVAAHFSPAARRREAGLHGLASYGVAALVMTVLFGSAAASAIGLATKAGVGAGAAVGANAVMDQMSQMRIVTDLSVLKGKAVTQFVGPKSLQANDLDKALEKAGAEAGILNQKGKPSKDTKAIAADSRRALSLGLFGLLGMILLGAASGYLGGSHAARARGAAAFAGRSEGERARAA